MGVLQEKLVQNLAQLTDTEKHIFYYLDSHLYELDSLNISNIALQVNTSTASISRIAHKLGFKNYSDFKQFIYYLQHNHTTLEKPEIFEHFNEQSINTIAKLILQAEHIFCIGVGLSKMNAEYFCKLLLQTGKEAIYTYDSHMINIIANNTRKDQLLVFVISQSGETKTLIETFEKLRFNPIIKTVAITSNATSQLNQICDYNMSAHSIDLSYHGYDVSPRYHITYLLDTLFYKYFELLKKEAN